jgi:hypothetical protein
MACGNVKWPPYNLKLRIFFAPATSLIRNSFKVSITLNVDDDVLAGLPLGPGERERHMQIELARAASMPRGGFPSAKPHEWQDSIITHSPCNSPIVEFPEITQ